MREMKDSGIQWIGEIPKDWGVSKIKHHFKIGSGSTPKSENLEYWDGDIVWITPADFKTDDVYVANGHRNLSEQGFQSGSLEMIPAGNIIFSKRAPIGQVVINSVPLCTNQGCLTAIPTDGSEVRYYRYLMSVATEEFEFAGSGTTFKEISATSFSNIKLPSMDFTDQRKVADYLDKKCSKIDFVIEKQKAVIDRLKTYRLAVISEAVTKGISSSVKMKDSGVEWIGLVPESWEPQKLAMLCDRAITYGIVKMGEYDDDAGVKALRCSDVLEGFIEEKNIRTVTEELSKEYSRTILKGGEVVINVRGTLGGCAVVPDHMAGYNIAREVAMVAVTKAIPKYVMYNLLSNVFKGYQEYSLRGVIYVGLNINLLNKYILFLPKEDEQMAIVDYLDEKCMEIQNAIEKKNMIVTKLTEYKKSLIYEVVTGKKEV